MQDKLMPLSLYDESSAEKNLKAAEMLFKSGLLPMHIKSPQAALYIVQRGMLLGLDPMTSLENTYLVNGRIFLGIHAAQGIISSRGGKWKIKENSRQKAEIEFYRDGWEPAVSVFDLNDAKMSGISQKTTFIQHTADILYANAFRKGARKMYPDWLMGMSILDEQEFRGRMVDVEVVNEDPATPEQPGSSPKTRRERKPPSGGSSVPPDASPATTEPNVSATTCDDGTQPQEAPVAPPQKTEPLQEEVPWCPEVAAHRLILTKVCNDLAIPNQWRSQNRKLVFESLESSATNREESVKKVVETIFASTNQ